ncbi:MAG: HAD family phosphatase, partial [Treponema sp.]|nr:HAD family phosphatase [Treponema sp.]
MSKKNFAGHFTPFIPEGVILDMDGLMLDTERLELQLYVEISAQMGWPTPETMLRKTIGISDEDAEVFYKNEYGAAYPFRKIWDAVVEKEYKIAEKDGLPHKTGLLILLDRLKQLEIPMAVATSANRKRAQWKLERGGILDRFNAFAFGDEIERGKPSPDIFLLAAERLGVNPQGCVGFEDSPAGLAGLAAAGIHSVFIKDMAEPAQEILRTVWRRCADLEVAASLFGTTDSPT